MKKNLIIPSLILILTLSAFNDSIRLEDSDEATPLVTEDPLLSLYGSIIFREESCLQCHVLEDATSLDALSLDGLGGKYTDIWHLWHLMNPRSMQPESGMPAFANILKMTMDENVWRNAYLETFPAATEQQVADTWEQLKMSSAKMRTHLLELDPSLKLPELSEMYALIAYLQSIPSSPRKLRVDSILHAQLALHEAAWISIADKGYSDIVAMVRTHGPTDLQEGRLLFLEYCSPCHRSNAGGAIGPNLTDAYWLYDGSSAGMAKSIAEGHPNKGMPKWRLTFSPNEIAQLITFIQSLQGSMPEHGKEPQGILKK
jgi:mono/diheme cytochrome c family protein